MFNNALFSGLKMTRVKPSVPHPSMTRLYEALKAIKNVEGQSAAAGLLGESPQRLNNWESRGMSKMGAVKIQQKFGISATWLLTGEGAMLSHGEWPFSPALLHRILSMDPALLPRIEGAIEGSLYAIESGELPASKESPRKNGTG